jgi:hypothetical protein
MKTPITGFETNISRGFTQRVLRASQKYMTQWCVHSRCVPFKIASLQTY